MKHLILVFLTISLLSCNQTKNNASTEEIITVEAEPKLDLDAELASIERTRAAFQLAIKEKRYGDLKQYGTPDVKSLTPNCGPWEPFKTLRDNPKGSFRYDSLVMRPRETIIVSDSIAYDFGTSSTYYTNEAGEPVELIATFLAVLKKDKTDGVWKLHREVANTLNLD